MHGESTFGSSRAGHRRGSRWGVGRRERLTCRNWPRVRRISDCPSVRSSNRIERVDPLTFIPLPQTWSKTESMDPHDKQRTQSRYVLLAQLSPKPDVTKPLGHAADQDGRDWCPGGKLLRRLRLLFVLGRPASELLRTINQFQSTTVVDIRSYARPSPYRAIRTLAATPGSARSRGRKPFVKSPFVILRGSGRGCCTGRPGSSMQSRRVWHVRERAESVCARRAPI